MKSTLALLSLVASVSAETKGIACLKPADCAATTGACCAYWKDNDTAATLRSTC